jgi:hypothetical protein
MCSSLKSRPHCEWLWWINTTSYWSQRRSNCVTHCSEITIWKRYSLFSFIVRMHWLKFDSLSQFPRCWYDSGW